MNQFTPVWENVVNTFYQVDASGAALMVMKEGQVVAESYTGFQSKASGARAMQEDTLFHLASVRKTFIGFAAAYLIREGVIQSLEQEVAPVFPEMDSGILEGVSIRHLITHTHGLRLVNGEIEKEFPAGGSWAYRNIGVDLLSEIIKKESGRTIANIVETEVLTPYGLTEIGWYGELDSRHVEVIRNENDPHWYTSNNVDGSKMNMYASVRDLAKWGALHLSKGKVEGKQLIPLEIFEYCTAVQSPNTLPLDYPRNGFFWFVQGASCDRTEIGEEVSKDAYQILGYTNVTLLVIPKHEIVAVRAFNNFGSPVGYDYLKDVRSFGNCVMECLQ
ncbi:serine hydrolase domain-containing protein [Viridibacillus arvi]|uniref:serine hydrolase domain-containing protein n=1 Tax=Viridibacillus arvi TaxID=263475 RepID=UPI00187B6E1E|nr:serine hydrolase domain-containing protein [Viridibacillus sp. JNUCC-6]QOV12326.1 beta-lactamase family protein [Viridibacillus sp. JNUCC-6]